MRIIASTGAVAALLFAVSGSQAEADVIAKLIERGVPQPKERPAIELTAFAAPAGISAPARAIQEAVSGAEVETATFKAALDAIRSDDYDRAHMLARKLTSRGDRRIVEWLVAQSPTSGASAETIVGVMTSHAGWPKDDTLRLRAETAFAKTRPSAAAIIQFYAASHPVSDEGKLRLAAARLETGDKEAARKDIVELWRNETLSASLEGQVLRKFSSLLTASDHRARVDMLLYRKHGKAALRNASRVGSAMKTYAAARISAYRGRSGAEKLLASLPDRFENDPGVLFAHASLLARKDKPVEAARYLIKAPRDQAALVDPDAWWYLRRSVSRNLLDLGRADLAYEVAAGHASRSEGRIADAEFHAGWYALRFLDKPEKARTHFEKLRSVATLPQTISRAEYWLGRTDKALNKPETAREAFARAAVHGTTYYGQLAAQEIGWASTGAEGLPDVSADDRRNFQRNELVQAIDRMAAVGHKHRTVAFFEHLGRTLTNPGEIRLVVEQAQRLGRHSSALTVAKQADYRGIAIGGLAFPVGAIPQEAVVPDSVNQALVYAISRQESAFNPAAVSPVGARGLMQLMPATAAEMARLVNVRYSRAKLIQDPAYNATLGAAYLDQQLARSGQSLIMTFAGYNAGPSRARRWAASYGDPRGGQTDPIDWVERIPFSETRNYVQKVMANYQTYRTRLGQPLTIVEDLSRGTPAS